MARLGDFFPEDDKFDHLTAQLTPGRVVRLFCNFTNPPKDKFVALLCPGMDFLVFVINSRIHPFISARPKLLACQVRLKAADYSFLKHDSYLDCSQVIALADVQVREQLSNDMSRIGDRLTTVTSEQIICAVQNAPTISPKHKHMIETALSSIE